MSGSISIRECLWVSERCPYCHEPITGGALERAICPGCRTAHHTSCLEELGTCTVLGCTRTFDQPSEPKGLDPQQELLKDLKRNFVRHAERLQRTEELLVGWEEELPIQITLPLRADRGVTDLLASSPLRPKPAASSIGLLLSVMAVGLLVFSLIVAGL